jgi:Na+/H+-translocating membrane pyrophosphatase
VPLSNEVCATADLIHFSFPSIASPFAFISAATNIIYGVALGYKSAIIPVLVLSLVIYGSFALCDMYGVALAAIGFLSNLATGLTIDVYGPVCDNAGM